MIIVNSQTLAVVTRQELLSLFPSTSFPAVLTNMCLVGFGHELVEEPPLPQLSRYERVVAGAPYRDGGEIKFDWEVVSDLPPLAAIVKDFERAIDSMLDDKAKEMRYDSVYTMISYRGDPNPKFDLEARSMFAWRSAVWTQANLMMEAFMQAEGAGEIPTPEEVIAQLPAFSLLESASS